MNKLQGTHYRNVSTDLLRTGCGSLKRLKKDLEVITGKHLIDALQKTAILGTSHIIRKVQQYET
jgi:hypothetical protein